MRALEILQSMRRQFTTLIWIIRHYIDSLVNQNNHQNTSKTTNPYWQKYHKEPSNASPHLTDTKKPTSCNYMMYAKNPTLHITVHWQSNTSWILLWSTLIHKSKIIPPTNRPSKPMIHRLIASISIPTISKYTMSQFQIKHQLKISRTLSHHIQKWYLPGNPGTPKNILNTS